MICATKINTKLYLVIIFLMVSFFIFSGSKVLARTITVSDIKNSTDMPSDAYFTNNNGIANYYSSFKKPLGALNFCHGTSVDQWRIGSNTIWTCQRYSDTNNLNSRLELVPNGYGDWSKQGGTNPQQVGIDLKENEKINSISILATDLFYTVQVQIEMWGKNGQYWDLGRWNVDSNNESSKICRPGGNMMPRIHNEWHSSAMPNIMDRENCYSARINDTSTFNISGVTKIRYTFILDGEDKYSVVHVKNVVINTEDVNTPPACSSLPLSISPSAQYYLPLQVVDMSAVNYTDRDGDPLTITNWQASSGVILSQTNNNKNISYRMPNLPNQTSTLTYVVSDGKSNVTCSYDVKTKLAFTCINQTCQQDVNGNYATNSDCLANCAVKMYGCTSDGQCVLNSTNPDYSTPNCDNMCSNPAAVTCDKINYNSPLVQGNQVLLSANLRNPGTGTNTYKWVSQNGSIDISSDPKCNTSTQTCIMDQKAAYTTNQVRYTVPNSDTVKLLVNGSEVPSCILNVNNSGGSGKDISINFDKPSYSISTGIDKSVILQTKPLDNIPTYVLSLTCRLSSGLPCPAGSFKFTNSNLPDITLSGLNATQIYDQGITLNFATPDTVTLTAFGDSVPSGQGLNRSALATVVVETPHNFNLSVRYAGDTEFLATNEEYCGKTYATTFSDMTVNFGKDSLPSVDYDLSLGQTPPKPISAGNYNLSASVHATAQKKEIKCIKINGVVVSASSTNFNVLNSDIDALIVVGPSRGNTWFQAFGGSAYSFSGFRSSIGDTVSRLISNMSGVIAGVLETNQSLEVGDGLAPEKYVIYPSDVSSRLVLKNLQDLSRDLDSSNITKISSKSNINYSPTSNPFYYYNGDLQITSTDNFIKPANNFIPVVFVNGKITINSDVPKVDLFLISNKNIVLGNNNSTAMDLNLHGSLISRGSFVFNSLSSVDNLNGKLTEKFYYDPSIFFSKSPNSVYFKTINIYASLID